MNKFLQIVQDKTPSSKTDKAKLAEYLKNFQMTYYCRLIIEVV